MRVLTVAAAAGLLAGCEVAPGVTVLDADRLRVNGHTLVLYGVDAPSTQRPHCESEREAALRAKTRLAVLTAPPAKIDFQKIGMACPMFLTCGAFVTVNGRDVANTLLSEGLVVEHQLEPHDWCAPPFQPEA